MNTTLEVLIDKYEERRNNITDSLASGVATDYAEYRAMCGEIRGLLSAERIAKDLAKNLEEADE